MNKRDRPDGYLIYTVVIENNSGDTYLKGVFADTLDTANVIFDKDYGVEIDGQKSSDYASQE